MSWPVLVHIVTSTTCIEWPVLVPSSISTGQKQRPQSSYYIEWYGMPLYSPWFGIDIPSVVMGQKMYRYEVLRRDLPRLSTWSGTILYGNSQGATASKHSISVAFLSWVLHSKAGERVRNGREQIVVNLQSNSRSQISSASIRLVDGGRFWCGSAVALSSKAG